MRLILAPMEGVVDHTMRDLLTSLGGIDRCVTEFVRVSSLLLPPRVFYRYCPELHRGSHTASGVPVYLQLLGGQAQCMADNAARAAELGAAGIDLNFGCPAKNVNNRDGGAALLREPKRVNEITATVRRFVPMDVPVTVKMRMGYEDRTALLDNALAAQAAGAAELVVHARSKVDGYRPPAYWEDLAELAELLSIPLVANGEIWAPDDALRCREVSGCSDLMLGRGALARPDLPRLVKARLADAPLEPLLWEAVLDLLIQYFHQIREHYDERHVPSPIKQWLVYLRHYHMPAALLFEQVKRIRDCEAMLEILTEARLSKGAGLAA